MRRGPFEPGHRDQVIAIQQLSESIDPDSGEPLETWSTLAASVPAARSMVRGMERFTASQESAQAHVRFEIAYRADMDPDQVDVAKSRRIVFFDRNHDIVEASQIGAREGVELIVLAKVG